MNPKRPETEIGLMNESDVDGVYAIECESFKTPWSRESYYREVRENDCARYMVIRERGQVIAYAGMWFVLDEAHITNVAVRSNRRGQGYGEMVMRALVQLAADSGMNWMTLEVRRSNLAAQGLYHKLGFIDVGYRKRYYENSEDALIMALEQLPEPNYDNDPYLLRAETKDDMGGFLCC